jgi:lysozyme
MAHLIMRAALILAAFGALLLAGRQAGAQAAPASGPAWAGGLEADPGQLPGYGFTFDLSGDAAAAPGVDLLPEPAPAFDLGFDAWGLLAQQADRSEAQQATSTDPAADNVRAFLAAIAAAEGTDKRADPYRVCYGYRHTIRSFADHPALSGEWAGESLDNLGPRYKGKRSTAAGRYQIIAPTWAECRRALGLQDFGPASQDAAAVYLIKRRGALPAVQRGEIQRAAALCASEWASLPGSTAGQPTVTLARLLDTYTDNGGALA